MNLQNIGNFVSNLLKQGGNAVQNVGNTVNQDVVQPVEHAVQSFTPNFNNLASSFSQHVQQAIPQVEQGIGNAVNTVSNQPILSNPLPYGMKMPFQSPTIGQTLPPLWQQPLRTAASISKSLLNSPFNNPVVQAGFNTPIGQQLSNAAFGKGPIQNLPQQIQSNQQSLSKVGLKGLPAAVAATGIVAGANALNLIPPWMGGGEGLSKSANYLKQVAQPEDINAIKDFATWVEQTGGKGIASKVGVDLNTIHSIARDVFGDKATNLSNVQLKNGFDAVLAEIGRGKNNLNLGLTTQNVIKEDAAKGLEKLGTPVANAGFIPPNDLIQKTVKYEGGWKTILQQKSTGQEIANVGSSPEAAKYWLKNGYPLENVKPNIAQAGLYDTEQAIKSKFASGGVSQEADTNAMRNGDTAINLVRNYAANIEKGVPKPDLTGLQGRNYNELDLPAIYAEAKKLTPIYQKEAQRLGFMNVEVLNRGLKIAGNDEVRLKSIAPLLNKQEQLGLKGIVDDNLNQQISSFPQSGRTVPASGVDILSTSQAGLHPTSNIIPQSRVAQQPVADVKAPISTGLPPVEQGKIPNIQAPNPRPNGGAVSSNLSIPQNMTQTEAKNIARITGLQGKPATIPTGETPLGLTNTIKESIQTTEPLKTQIQGAYDVAGNKATLASAQQRIATSPEEAYQFAVGNHNAEANATAVLLAKHYESLGQTEQAANLMVQKAKQALQAGQGNQIYSVWDKLSPETVGQTAAKIIEDARAKGAKIPALSPEQYQYFVNSAKNIQSITDERQKGIATQNLLNELGKLIPSSGISKAVSFWRAGLLTGPKTVAKIITSHAAFGTSGLEKLKDIPAAGVDIASSILTGKRSMALTARGMIQGTRNGINAMVDNLVHGYNAPNSGGFAKDFTKQVNYGDSLFGKAAQAYVDGIQRLHGSLYKPFFGSLHLNSLYDQALTEAGNQGLKGAEKEAFVTNFVKNPPPVAQETALKEAEYGTFQNRTTLGGIASNLGQAGGGLGHIIVPFTQIPSSIAMKVVDYSPIGAAKTVIESIKNGNFDQRTFSQGIGRSITGTAIYAIGAALAAKGMLSLSYPSSPSERALWQAQGRKEDSVLIGGQWRALTSLGPVGDAIAVGGHLYEGLQKNGIGGAAQEGLAGGMSVLANAPYVQELNAISQTLTDPVQNAAALGKNLAASVVPTLIGNIATATDPLQRQTNNIAQSITNKIPGLREQNLPQTDVLGNQVPRAQGVIGSMVDPFYSSTNRPTPLINELQRLQDTGNPASLSALAKNATQTIQGVKTKLNPTQVNTLTQQQGAKINTDLNNLINSPDYKALADEDKANAINSVVAADRKAVRGTINLNNPSATQTIPPSGTAKTYTLINPTTGAVRTIDLSKPIIVPIATGNALLDKKMITSYNSAVTTRANDIVALYNAKRIDAPTAEGMLEQLNSQKAGATGIGGTAKVKKIGAIKAPAFHKATAAKLTLGNKGVTSTASRSSVKGIKFAKPPKMATTKVSKNLATKISVKQKPFKVASQRIWLSNPGSNMRYVRKVAGISIPVKKRKIPRLFA